jgi:hypothetical protein
LRTTFRWKAGGLDDIDGPEDWEFRTAADDTAEDLYEFYDGAVERSRARIDAAVADGGLDQLVHVSDDGGNRASLRRLVCDLAEEYGRHTGDADLLWRPSTAWWGRTRRPTGVPDPVDARDLGALPSPRRP